MGKLDFWRADFALHLPSLQQLQIHKDAAQRHRSLDVVQPVEEYRIVDAQSGGPRVAAAAQPEVQMHEGGCRRQRGVQRAA